MYTSARLLKSPEAQSQQHCRTAAASSRRVGLLQHRQPLALSPALRERLQGLPSALVALLASACLATGPACATNDTEALFANTCAGCHAGGGNVVRRDATLQLADLQKNGLADSKALYQVIYSGRGSMPGYGADCAPKLQCTFGPRLSDDDIRGLAEFVLAQAGSNWGAAAQ